GLLLPLTVGRPASLAAAEAALEGEDQEIVLFAQRDATVDEPAQNDLYTIGTKAIVRKVARPAENMMELFVFGVERIILLKVTDEGPFQKARVRTLSLPTDMGPEIEALQRAVTDLATKAISFVQAQTPVELERLINSAEDPLRLVYLVASMLSLDLPKAQALLESPSRLDALRLMHTYLSYEVQVLELRAKIATEARSEMSKEQREYLLRQQMRAIQQELGEKNPEQAESEQLRQRLAKADLPDDVRKEAERELARMERLPTAAPDYHV